MKGKNQKGQTKAIHSKTSTIKPVDVRKMYDILQSKPTINQKQMITSLTKSGMPKTKAEKLVHRANFNYHSKKFDFSMGWAR